MRKFIIEEEKTLKHGGKMWSQHSEENLFSRADKSIKELRELYPDKKYRLLRFDIAVIDE